MKNSLYFRGAGEGTALRIIASRRRRELRSQGAWYRELFRFSHALMAQVSQTAACNRFHRVGVTAAATSLQKQGLIRYSRGSIEVLDPKGLEAVACDCYRIVSGVYRRTFDR